MSSAFKVEIEREDDGRWIAEVTDLPGVLAYGTTRDGAIQSVEALALSRFEELVADWEREVASISAGKPRCDEDCYLNEMDGRRILHDVLEAAPDGEFVEWRNRVSKADDLVRPHLVPTRECIWGERNAATHGYDRDRHWWYFHRPRVDDDLFV